MPVLTAGLGSPALPLWAATRAAHGKTEASLATSTAHARLYAQAAGFALAVALVVVLTALAPTDATGNATGPLNDATGAVLLVNMIVAVVYAVRLRARVYPSHPRPAPADLEALPGVWQARARRELRERYRQLAASDVMLARDMGVGRPDRPRQFDDGGLLDLNTLDGPGLVHFGGLTPAEAEDLVRARQRLGQLSNADELVVCTELSEATVERLREYGLFVTPT
jgi:hypothetical protein